MNDDAGRFAPKYQPGEDRPCPRCERTLPPDAFHAKTRNPDGSIRLRQTLCKECSRDRQREINGTKPKRKPTDEERKRRRRLYYLRARNDPSRKERMRVKKREQARRRRERAKTDEAVAQSIREAGERYRQKILADDEAHAMRLIDQRIRYRTMHPEGAVHSGAVEAYDDSQASQDWVPTEPFFAFIESSYGGMETGDLADMLGIEAQRLKNLREQARVSLSVVDAVLTAGLGRPDLLNALYPVEDTA